MDAAVPGAAVLPRLMLVTDRRRMRGRDPCAVVAEAVRGGVGFVQVREPDLPDDELRALVAGILRTIPDDVRVVVNGRPRVARTLRLGLHLAAADSKPAGRYPLLGRSAHDDEEALAAVVDRASYLILGTIYPSESKPGHGGSGAALITRVTRLVRPLPIYAIGGITVSRVSEVIHAGAHGVAVCGAIVSARDPRRVAEALTLALKVALAAGR
jgi:thiamine-phosphate pyrophosphorylase